MQYRQPHQTHLLLPFSEGADVLKLLNSSRISFVGSVETGSQTSHFFSDCIRVCCVNQIVIGLNCLLGHRGFAPLHDHRVTLRSTSSSLDLINLLSSQVFDFRSSFFFLESVVRLNMILRGRVNFKQRLLRPGILMISQSSMNSLIFCPRCRRTRVGTKFFGAFKQCLGSFALIVSGADLPQIFSVIF